MNDKEAVSIFSDRNDKANNKAKDNIKTNKENLTFEQMKKRIKDLENEKRFHGKVPEYINNLKMDLNTQNNKLGQKKEADKTGKNALIASGVGFILLGPVGLMFIPQAILLYAGVKFAKNRILFGNPAPKVKKMNKTLDKYESGIEKKAMEINEKIEELQEAMKNIIDAKKEKQETVKDLKEEKGLNKDNVNNKMEQLKIETNAKIREVRDGRSRFNAVKISDKSTKDFGLNTMS